MPCHTPMTMQKRYKGQFVRGKSAHRIDQHGLMTAKTVDQSTDRPGAVSGHFAMVVVEESSKARPCFDSAVASSHALVYKYDSVAQSVVVSLDVVVFHVGTSKNHHPDEATARKAVYNRVFRMCTGPELQFFEMPMYSLIAKRRCFSPKGMILFRHSDLMDKTKRSVNAFRFGLRAGNRTGFVALSLSIFQKTGGQQWISVRDEMAAPCNGHHTRSRRRGRSDYEPSTSYRLHPGFTGLSCNADDLRVSRLEAYHE